MFYLRTVYNIKLVINYYFVSLFSTLSCSLTPKIFNLQHFIDLRFVLFCFLEGVKGILIY